MAAPASDLGADCVHRAIVSSRHICGMAAANDVNGRFAALGFERPKFFGCGVVLGPLEVHQRRYGRGGFLPDRFGVGAVEDRLLFVGRD